MFRIPYRWTWRTTHKNIDSMFYDVFHGIRNIVRWVPVIWFDRNWDWVYFAEIMEYKLRQMSNHEKNLGHHATSTIDSRDMLVCAEILRRLIDDNEQGKDYAIHDRNMKDLNKLFGKIMGTKLRSWWD